ncbi:MAG: flippase-like domain-containing protein [Bacteroidia bacterium]|nr:flippase-like domain-containing protein [Bacteroidia bacterium]
MFKIIKWLVPVLIAFALYKRFFNNPHLSVQFIINEIQVLDWYWLPFLLVLSVLNWGIETRKWQYLICKLEIQSFKVAFKSVLCGITVAQLLPFRTGEYLGRLAYVKDENKINAGILSIAGSFTQLVITLFVGAIAFLFIRPFNIPYSFIVTFSTLLVLLILGYFHLPQMQFLRKMFLFKTIHEALKMLKVKDVLRLIGFSFLRYLVFLFPYALLIVNYNLGIETGLIAASLSAACIFLLQTVSPSFILTDLAVRISVPAIVLSGTFEASNPIDYLPGMIIYTVNVLLPMLLGAIILLTIKLKK